jgi:hypothetical protein
VAGLEPLTDTAVFLALYGLTVGRIIHRNEGMLTHTCKQMCTHLAALTGMYAIVETRGLVAANTAQYCCSIEFCGKRTNH